MKVCTDLVCDPRSDTLQLQFMFSLWRLSQFSERLALKSHHMVLLLLLEKRSHLRSLMDIVELDCLEIVIVSWGY